MGAIADMAVAGSAAEQKARVLLVAPPDPGGVGRHLLALARGLDRNQYDVCVACPRSGSIGEEADALGLEVFCVAVGSTPSPVKAMSTGLALSRVIARGGFHLVHAHSFSASLAASLAREFTAWPILVSSVHDRLMGPKRMEGAVHRWALRMIARKADRIVTTCQALNAVFGDVRRAEKKLVTIPDGVDLEQIADTARRAGVGQAMEAPVVGVLGGFPQTKPAIEPREGLAQVENRLPQAKFVPVADRPAGERSHPGEFELVVVLPPCEGFPTEAVEAMAAGKAVCGYAQGCLSEVVVEGETGLLAPEGDGEALARAVESLLVDRERAQAMGEAGRERVRHEFSLPVMIERTQDLYADLVRIHIVEGGRS